MTADQARAARQLRIGRVAAATSYLTLSALFLLAINPRPVQTRMEPVIVSGVITAVFVTFVVSASVALAIAAARWRLAPAHRWHSRWAQRVWVLIPLGFFAGILGWSVGPTLLLLSVATVVALLVALSDSSLRRLERVGHQASRRVCVINLDRGTQTWHTEDELRALDEASQALRAGMGYTPDGVEPA